jgi:hypothetical protein
LTDCHAFGALLCAILLLAWPVSSVAQVDVDKRTLSIVYENDVFYNTDQHYTNGVRIAWLSGLNDVPEFMREAAAKSILFPEEGNARVEFALGQNMYTPSDITLSTPPEDDRPYAGWLYGAVGLIAENGKRLHQLELQIGMVGRASLAEKTQTFVHEYITDSDEPQGWDTQLPNEPTLQLTYLRSWRALAAIGDQGFGADLTPQFGLALGTVSTMSRPEPCCAWAGTCCWTMARRASSPALQDRAISYPVRISAFTCSAGPWAAPWAAICFSTATCSGTAAAWTRNTSSPTSSQERP